MRVSVVPAFGAAERHRSMALSLALGVTGTTCADEPEFPAPTGDPAFVPAGAKLADMFQAVGKHPYTS